MTQHAILPAPVLPMPAEGKWRCEQQAFHRLLSELLLTHQGQYIAVHEEQVVESGSDKLDVAARAYARHGYVAIYVGLVTDQPAVPIRMPSPRLLPAGMPS